MNNEMNQQTSSTAELKLGKTTVTIQGGHYGDPSWGPKWVIKNPANLEEKMEFGSPYYLAVELFRLKAEVERLTAEVNYRKNMDTHIKIMADQYTPAKEGKPSV